MAKQDNKNVKINTVQNDTVQNDQNNKLEDKTLDAKSNAELDNSLESNHQVKEAEAKQFARIPVVEQKTAENGIKEAAEVKDHLDIDAQGNIINNATLESIDPTEVNPLTIGLEDLYPLLCKAENKARRGHNQPLIAEFANLSMGIGRTLNSLKGLSADAIKFLQELDDETETEQEQKYGVLYQRNTNV